jgi:hypothetical protein
LKHRPQELAGCEARGTGRIPDLGILSDPGLEAEKLRNRAGKEKAPITRGAGKSADDPHWRDYLLFHEYFHGDNRAGIGASHQTGRTGLVAKLLQQCSWYARD